MWGVDTVPEVGARCNDVGGCGSGDTAALRPNDKVPSHPSHQVSILAPWDVIAAGAWIRRGNRSVLAPAGIDGEVCSFLLVLGSDPAMVTRVLRADWRGSCAIMCSVHVVQAHIMYSHTIECTYMCFY